MMLTPLHYAHCIYMHDDDDDDDIFNIHRNVMNCINSCPHKHILLEFLDK